LVVKEGLLVIAGTFSPKKLNINGSGSHTVNVGGGVYLERFENGIHDNLCVDSSGIIYRC